MSIEEANPHDRKFGVEIECGGLGYDEANALFDTQSVSPDEHWSIGEDGTEVEVRTPILQGEAGYETLRWAMNRLVKEGALVTEADGMHVHHDAPEFVDNPELCVNLVHSWRRNEKSIYSLVAPRRRGYDACPRWNPERYEILKAWAAGNSTLYVGRYDLNIQSLQTHGSIEIRLHEGTLDPDVAIAWVQFGQRFIHQVLLDAKPLPIAATDMDLLSRIQLSPEAMAILEAKRNAGHDTSASRFDPNYRYPDDDYDDRYY